MRRVNARFESGPVDIGEESVAIAKSMCLAPSVDPSATDPLPRRCAGDPRTEQLLDKVEAEMASQLDASPERLVISFAWHSARKS
jgi:hypothetical protein